MQKLLYLIYKKGLKRTSKLSWKRSLRITANIYSLLFSVLYGNLLLYLEQDNEWPNLVRFCYDYIIIILIIFIAFIHFIFSLRDKDKKKINDKIKKWEL